MTFGKVFQEIFSTYFSIFCRVVASRYGVPATCVKDWCRGDYLGKMGHKTLLTTAEEQDLEDFCILLQRAGTPITAKQLCHEVALMLENDERGKKLKNGRPSKYKIL